MAESSSQDRTLPATPRKLGKAREEGQVARSRDLGHFAAIAVGGAILFAAAPFISDWMRETLMQGLRFDRVSVQNTGYMGQRLSEMTVRLLWVILPFSAAMAATGMAASIAIGGWNWTLKPLQPKFAKLNPLTGFANLFSSDKLVDALRASGLALILGVIGWMYLKGHVDDFTGALAMPLPAGIRHGIDVMTGGLVPLLIALGVFAMIDVPWQRHKHAKSLKMSHTEVKQERKEAEGSVEVKQKVRARAREINKRRMLVAVPSADLVVMNPTHYAVALKYDDKSMGAPRVIAKGADLFALRIRDVARDSKVPVLEAPVLARALYAHAELDREVPAALFAAVAQVLAYVYQLRAALAGRAAMPNALPELVVPAELDPHHKPLPNAPNMEDFE